jgi:PAS domain S-box-containing protein
MIYAEVNSHIISYSGRDVILASASDITDKLHAEQSLRSLQANQEALINSTDDLVWSVDIEYKLIAANSAFVESLKQSTGMELKPGDNLLLFGNFPDDFINLWKTQYDRCLAGEAFESEIHTPAGPNYPETWTQIRFNPIYGTGRIIGVACFSRDVTHSKQTEQRILSINQKLETAQQIARLGYWELDVLNQKLFWTKQVYSIWGVDAEKTETSYEFFIKSIHPDDLEEFYARQKEAWIPGGKLDFEHRIILPDGSTRYVHEKGEIIRNEAGEPIRLEGTVQDITERKQALSRLEESEEQYRYLFMKSPMPKWIYELDSLRIREVNEAAINKYGYSRDQFLSMTIKEIRPPEDGGKMGALSKKVAPGSTVYFGQWRHRTANGEILHVEVSGHLTMHQGKEMMMIVSVDVTERVKAAELLAQSNERFEYVAKATFDAIWDWNLQTDHLYWGEGFRTMFGYDFPNNEVEINSWSDNIHPEDREMVIADVTRFIEETKESLWTMEYRFQRANGTYAYVIDKGLVIRDEHGRGLRMIGALTDVSRLKEIELRLASERNLLRILVDTLPDYVYVKDPQARHILNNKKMVQLLGATTEEETVGKRLDELMPAELAQIYLVDDKEVVQSRQPIHNKLEPLILPTGERRWLSTSKIPVLDSNGEVTAIVGISRDITETREVQHERELALRINQVFAENESLEKSLLSMLEECCKHFRQDLAEVWIMNSDRNLLRLSAIYSITNKVLESDEGAVFRKGEGLPGWVWENEQSVCVSDLQQEHVYKRKRFASANQLNRATAIPVYFNRQVIAVLVFYESALNKTAAAPIIMGTRLLAQIAGDIQRKKSESELNRFFTFAPELLCIAGPDGYFKKVNPAFTRLLGYSEEEMLSRPFTEFVHPDDLNSTINEIKDATSTRVSYSFVNRYRTKDGSWKWISWSSSTPITADGLVFGYGKDITELKQAETNLLLYKKVIEMSRDGIGIINIVNGEVYTNKSFRDLIHLTEGEIKGMEDAISLYEDKEQARSMFQTLASGNYWNGDVQLRSRTGELIDFYLSAGPVMDEQGRQIALFGVHTDIRERKKLERRLVEYNSRITNILESITDGFFSVDHEWKVTYWNKEAERLLQKKRSEILGQNLWSQFADAMSLQFYTEYHRAVSEKTSVHFEEFFPPLGVWVEVSAYPSQDGLSIYFKDITERKQAEEAIRLSNERYDLVARATSDAIWDWDLVTGRTIRTGDGFTALFGYDKEDANNDPEFWNNRVHPEDLVRVHASHELVFSDPKAFFWEEEYRFLKANGFYAWVYDKGTIIRNEQGEAIRMIGATQDITQQKEQVNEIIRIQQNLDTLINSTTDLIWSVDGDMRIISANRAFCDSIAQLTGKQVVEGMLLYDESFPQEVREFWHQRYQKALSGEGFSVEDAFIYPGKEEKQHAIITFTPIFDKAGEVRGVACFAKDVTAIKQSAEQLEELNRQLLRKTEELASSNVELERFAYVASHDLQEPLRMVSSFLQLLKKKYNTQLDETGQGYIDFAVDGAERMKRLIKDLLDYSRLDSKEEDLDDTDMNQVVQEVIYTLGERIRKQNAIVETGPLPMLPKTHRTQLFQLMQNLISNGLKYNKTEQPTVRVHALEQADHWLFEVRDNGIGIDPKYFDKIFVIFQRLHNRTQYSGTGIGLAVCKKIVERAGGMIWVKSVPDSGSSFYFTIPKRNS